MLISFEKHAKSAFHVFACFPVDTKHLMIFIIETRLKSVHPTSKWWLIQALNVAIGISIAIEKIAKTKYCYIKIKRI